VDYGHEERGHEECVCVDYGHARRRRHIEDAHAVSDRNIANVNYTNRPFDLQEMKYTPQLYA